MDHYMETCNADICINLETIIDRIPPKMELIEYNVPVMGTNSTSASSNVNNPTYIFYYKILVLWALDRMMHFKLVAMEDSSSIYS